MSEGIISGKVTFDDYSVPNAEVIAVSEGDEIKTTQTDMFGNYKFDNLDPDKTYNIFVEYENEDADISLHGKNYPFVEPNAEDD